MPLTRRALLAAAGTAASAALAGCSLLDDGGGRSLEAAADGAWPTRHGNNARTGYNDVAGVTEAPQRQWPDHAPMGVQGAAFAADGSAFVVHHSGVTAFDADGSIRWRPDTEYSGPLLTERALAVQSSDGHSMAGISRESGERVWTADGSEPYALSDGRVVTSPESAAVGAIRVGAGKAWGRDAPARQYDFVSVLAATDDLVVVPYVSYYQPYPDAGYEEGRTALVAYDAASGDQRWRTDLQGPVDRVAVRDGLVHVGTHVRNTDSSAVAAFHYALAAQDGYVESRRVFPGATVDGFVVGPERVYVAAGSTLAGFDHHLGGPRWTSTLPSSAKSLAASGSTVYATWVVGERPDSRTVVAGFDAASGTELWRKSLPTPWGAVAGVTAGRVYIVGDGEVGLFALA